jgi:hypothetical protein
MEEKNQHVSDNEFPELVQYISDATKKSGDDGRMKIISFDVNLLHSYLFLTNITYLSFAVFQEMVDLADVCGMVNYSDRHNEYMSSVFPPKDIRNCLGEVVSDAGLTQLRAAETEKYPHVTFFMNGGREEPFVGEKRILVPSPKGKKEHFQCVCLIQLHSLQCSQWKGNM